VSFLNLIKQLRNYKLKALTGRFVSGGSHEFFSVFCPIIMMKDTMREGSTIKPTPRSETARLTSRVFKVFGSDESFVKA